MNKFCLVILFFIKSIEGHIKVTATTPLGEIAGSIGLTVNNNPYFSFEGVPYAKPPVGDLRFEAPEPVEPWSDVREAKNGTKCLQYNHFSEFADGSYQVEGDEDCLHLNIYTHSLSQDANLDVLVYIHGGAYMFGAGANFGPQIIMDRELVYVSLNYRLGPLGFLSTEDDIIPGNNGLKDQIMALKWVKRYIRYFGGNPESITISGMSAGGSSVHLHYLMPESRGLFKGGISQSGCALNSWVLLEHPLEKARKLANSIGCPTKTSGQIKQCLKATSAREIVKAVKEFQPWLYNPFSPFGVVVDTWARNPTLPDHPYKLLSQGKVQDLPWIISYTSAEGLYPASDFYSNELYLSDIDANWNDIMPHILHYNCSVEPAFRDEVSRKIREYYLGEEPVDRKSYSKLVELIGDRLFVADIEKAARLHSSAVKSDIYSYTFNYRGANSKSDLRTGSNVDIGVAHGDDTIYVIKTAVDTLSTANDRAISKILTDMFVSFMQTGVPDVGSEWLPLKKSLTEPYLQLKISGPGDLKMEEKGELGHRTFWDSLPFLENDRFDRPKDEL